MQVKRFTSFASLPEEEVLRIVDYTNMLGIPPDPKHPSNPPTPCARAQRSHKDLISPLANFW